jgi:curved DNA-binding protein CbpA
MNPYLILGVPREADDQRIRRAYLEALRQATPETNPERFKAVTTAYEQIKDQTSRHQHELLNRDCPGDSPLDAFLGHIQAAPRPAPLAFEGLKELLRLCSKS